MTHAWKQQVAQDTRNCSKSQNYIIQMCSGITRGRVPNGKLYAQRLHLLTVCFIKISPQSLKQIENCICSDD